MNQAYIDTSTIVGRHYARNYMQRKDESACWIENFQLIFQMLSLFVAMHIKRCNVDVVVIMIDKFFVRVRMELHYCLQLFSELLLHQRRVFFVILNFLHFISLDKKEFSSGHMILEFPPLSLDFSGFHISFSLPIFWVKILNIPVCCAVIRTCYTVIM